MGLWCWAAKAQGTPHFWDVNVFKEDKQPPQSRLCIKQCKDILNYELCIHMVWFGILRASAREATEQKSQGFLRPLYQSTLDEGQSSVMPDRNVCRHQHL